MWRSKRAESGLLDLDVYVPAREMMDDTPADLRVATGARIRVLLLDAHQLLAEALTIVLGADPDLEVVGSVADPRRALAQVRQARPDVVLMSYFLMHQDDARLAAALRSELPQLKILILTSTVDENTLFACVQAGAVGYVTKDRPPSELADAIKRVHAGEVLFAPNLLVKLLTRSQRQSETAISGPSVEPLTPRELEVLRAVATGMSTEEAAAHLGITVHTMRTHLKNVMIKLQARSKLEAVIVALRAGLIQLNHDSLDGKGSAQSHAL